MDMINEIAYDLLYLGFPFCWVKTKDQKIHKCNKNVLEIAALALSSPRAKRRNNELVL